MTTRLLTDGASCPDAPSGHPVMLTTRDGVRFDVRCAPGEDVLSAAARAGYVLPSMCHKGSCGACSATVEGAHELGEHSPQALPEKDRAAGASLLCCTYPTEPLQVSLPFEGNRVIHGSVPERQAQVLAVDAVSPDGLTVRVRLALEPDEVSGAAVEFESGQFVEVSLPGLEVRRAYSLANVANWDGEAELLVRRQPGGWFSGILADWLANGFEGAQVVVRGPMGAFGLHENGVRPRWFVAGGTGLAPLASMVRRMAEWGDPQPVRIYLGVNAQPELPDLDLLPELAEAFDALPDAALVPCVWHPDGAWDGVVGTPADALEKDLTELVAASCGGPVDWPDLYVCGPPALVDAATRAAVDVGVPADQVHSERCLPS